MPELVARVLDDLEPIAELARGLALSSTVLFLGRHVGYPVALEGALKIKELADGTPRVLRPASSSMVRSR